VAQLQQEKLLQLRLELELEQIAGERQIFGPWK
jgi:hypothetical protein